MNYQKYSLCSKYFFSFGIIIINYYKLSQIALKSPFVGHNL